MSRTWRTDKQGRIIVSDNGGAEYTPMATPVEQVMIDTGVAKYGPLFKHYANEYGIPWTWLVAMAKRESGFNPNAQSYDGGWGLFQITDSGLKGGRTFEQLANPATNTMVAANYISGIVRRYGGDFPTVTATFNAGSPRADASSPWNLHATTDHIDDEVRTLNYTITKYDSRLMAGVGGGIIAVGIGYLFWQIGKRI
jgi:soluble lytic murein transglycosylase-like protein